MVDGLEARLGSPEFCGVAPGADAGLSRVALRWGERTATFQMKQTLRPDAVEVVETLREQGFSLEILSGDGEAAVEEAAQALGIARWRGGLKPAEKVARLEALARKGAKVLMIGDGVNDAPALAAARASLSPSSATDLAQNVADAVFLGERLAPAAAALATGRRARRAMRQNFALAFLYNVLALPLAASGHLTPLIAAAAMSGSSLLVTLNALSVRRGAD